VKVSAVRCVDKEAAGGRLTWKALEMGKVHGDSGRRYEVNHNAGDDEQKSEGACERRGVGCTNGWENENRVIMSWCEHKLESRCFFSF
jgi:hypothetical protein